MRLVISLIGISVTSLKLCIGVLRALYCQQAVTVFSNTVLGKRQTPMTLRVFKVANKPLANVDVWFHYFKGNIDLVGPKALDQAAVDRLTTLQRARFQVAPGLISPYQVRKRSGIAYVTEKELASEFALSATNSRRLQILLAAGFQSLIGNTQKGLAIPRSFKLFGVRISNVSMQDAIEQIMSDLARPAGAKLKRVAFVNADCVNKYVTDKRYFSALTQSDYVYADGIGVRIAARWHNARLLDNVNGTDMFPQLCKQLSKQSKKVFLYGGSHDVVSRVAQKLQDEFPLLEVVGALDGFSLMNDAPAVCDQINASNADIVFVAKGAPLQERWLQDNAHQIHAKVAVGVGGLFDFYSGHVTRAPILLRELSLEWVWRLMMQPKDKAKRYLLGNPLFLAKVLRSISQQNDVRNTLEVS